MLAVKEATRGLCEQETKPTPFYIRRKTRARAPRVRRESGRGGVKLECGCVCRKCGESGLRAARPAE
jgi:hypothetical protein